MAKSDTTGTEMFAPSTTCVTVGLPFAEKPLDQFAAAVRSVFAQTHQNWVLLLVSDGASRECLEFARSIADPRVYVEANERQAGLARRLNDIADMAETEYLFRMDADDVMHRERLSRQLALLGTGAADLIGSRAYLIDDSNRIHGLMRESPGLPSRRHTYLANSPILMHPTLAASTQWFRANRYDVDLLRAEDKALFINSVSSTRMVKMAEPLLFYRVARPFGDRRLHFEYDRAVIKKYGRLVASKPRMRTYLVKSYMKQRLFQIMCQMGKEDYLYDRKIDRISPADLIRAQHELKKSMAPTLPGLALRSFEHKVDFNRHTIDELER